MGGIKPIGSEKLDGMDKIRRIMQIARYNEAIPQPVNETAKSEYKIELADGKTYEIVKERQGYIIKESISDSADYIEPIQNRKYFSSYSQALKKMNLMAKEFNSLYENEEGTSLLGEQKKKYILKRPKSKNLDAPTPDVAATPAPEPITPPTPEPVDAEPTAMPPVDADMGGEMGMAPVDADTGGDTPPPADDMGGEMGMAPVDSDLGGDTPPPSDDMGGEMGPPSDDETDDTMPEDDDTEEKTKGPSEFKRIQILVGKLAQKIRSYEENEDLSAKDVKYIINSILSAIDVDVLDEDDIEQIISKLEGEDEDEDNKEMGGDVEDDTLDSEEPPVDEDEPLPSEEMGETYSTYGEAFNDYLGSTYAKLMSDDLTEDDDDYGVTDSEISKWDDIHNQRERKLDQLDVRDFFKKSGDHMGGFNDKMRKLEKYGSEEQSFDTDEFMEEDEDNYKMRRRGGREINPQFKHLEHGTFGESKLDKLLSKYYVVNENEIKHNFSKKVDTEFQLESVVKYLKNNPNSKFMGKTMKGNLIFKNGLVENKITKSGIIL